MGIQVFKGVAQQRARLLGQIKRLDERMRADQAKRDELQRKVAAFDEVLREQGIDIDPDMYAPVKPTPRRTYFAHGELLGLCFDAMRLRKCPVTTPELLDYVVAQTGVRWKTPEDRYETRRSIKNAMRVQAKKGLVVRVGSTGLRHDDIAIWALPEYAAVERDDLQVHTTHDVEAA
ncbi:hypothetical protein ACI2VH_05980 [Ralstonia nicotianae]|uniref:Uncharacterized protein n=1 Tax=Ralstonia nicotianae TaxID=3037696 RepID=A0ABX7ZWY9_9RALS|nr:hypothetical protein [Ralstonia nicotianae]QUP59766.1 hypothetical protein GO999_15060 [Ralstonia nicotianae]